MDFHIPIVTVESHMGNRTRWIQDGQPRETHGNAGDGLLEDLRAHVRREEVRIQEAIVRLARSEALLEWREREEAITKEMASIQRRTRSAATRAHNRDPFGFRAAEEASEASRAARQASGA